MNILQFILFKKNGTLSLDGKIHAIPQNHIVVADENATPVKKNNDDFVFITCYPVNLLPLHKILFPKPPYCHVASLQERRL